MLALSWEEIQAQAQIQAKNEGIGAKTQELFLERLNKEKAEGR